MDMEKLLSGDFPFYRFRNLSAYPELMHFVSSGVKNIGFSDRENPEIIQYNRRSLAKAAGFEVERLITARQVHSATVRLRKPGEGLWIGKAAFRQPMPW